MALGDGLLKHPSVNRWFDLWRNTVGLEIDLGVKGESGILTLMQTRSDFLRDSSHKIVLH